MQHQRYRIRAFNHSIPSCAADLLRYLFSPLVRPSGRLTVASCLTVPFPRPSMHSASDVAALITRMAAEEREARAAAAAAAAAGGQPLNGLVAAVQHAEPAQQPQSQQRNPMLQTSNQGEITHRHVVTVAGRSSRIASPSDAASQPSGPPSELTEAACTTTRDDMRTTPWRSEQHREAAENEESRNRNTRWNHATWTRQH